MTAPLDWRKIEVALVDIFRQLGVDVYQSEGAWFADGVPTSLTALARRLADELSPPP